MMSSDDKIKRLEDERRQLSARIQRLKALQTASDRKRDTRRKILAGAAVLAEVAEPAGVIGQAELMVVLDRRLKNERDRKLFELPTQQGETRAQGE